jgi:fucose permease
VIHSTPYFYGAANSQLIIGVQMASAYVGNLLMPPLFGVIADILGAEVLPLYLGGILLVMVLMHRRMVRICSEKE